jgi:hypothetical protein
MSESLAIREAESMAAWTPRQLLQQVQLVQQVMKEAMQDGEHFGVIPGTQKPTLLQPGAQKLCMTFRLAPEYEVYEKDLGAGHREYRIGCTLKSITTGVVIGSGVGICSTMESKYRYRQAERLCPCCGKPAIIKGKVEWGGGYVCYEKKGGCKAKFKDGDTAIEGQKVGRVENPDVADTYNTVLKMGKKRAFVDATVTALAVSDIFTQDLEETVEHPKDVTPPPQEAPKDVTPPPQKPTLPTVDEWTKNFLACQDEGSLKVTWAGYYDIREQYNGEEQTAIMRAKDRRKVSLSEAK